MSLTKIQGGKSETKLGESLVDYLHTDLSGEKEAPEHWRDWLRLFFPEYVDAPFASHHAEIWNWAWNIDPYERLRPFISILARGGGKSTTAELLAAALGARDRRTYVVYVCATQDQANKHVKAISSLIESRTIEEYYPAFASRKLTKYGHSKGWTKERLVTSSGVTYEAIGLDKSVRGVKEDADRPDFIILDDLDGEHDTPNTTSKKIDKLTKKVLPLGGDAMTVLGVQNLVHRNSIFARLADGRAEFLADRIVSGPHKAVQHLEYERVPERDKGIWVITGGEPTWEGQDLENCQQKLDDFGLQSFLSECQHEVYVVPGALWDWDELDDTRTDDPPAMRRIIISIDPAVTNNDESDETGIIVCGIGIDGHGYVLEDLSGSYSPNAWAKTAVAAYYRHQADRIVGEVNNGGDMVKSTIKTVDRSVAYKEVRASRGKQIRAEPVSSLYEDRMVHHVGAHQRLEEQMTTWDPANSDDSPDRVDALVWGMTELIIKQEEESGVMFV